MPGAGLRQRERVLRASLAALPPAFVPMREPIDWGALDRVAAYAALCRGRSAGA